MSHQLTDEQVERYFERGFLGPFELQNRSKIEEAASHITEEVLPSEGPWSTDDLPEILYRNHADGASTVDRHLDCLTVSNLCQDPAITERAASLYGEDLLLLFTQLIKKQPGGKAIGWHQDRGFYGLHPSICPTIWIACSKVTRENGCLEFIPRTSDTILPHKNTERRDNWFDYEADPDYVEEHIDTEESVKLEMEPGEFIIFNNTALHRSGPNTSKRPRVALQIRATVPYARIHNPKRPEARMVQMSGDNPYGVHETGSAPTECHH